MASPTPVSGSHVGPVLLPSYQRQQSIDERRSRRRAERSKTISAPSQAGNIDRNASVSSRYYALSPEPNSRSPPAAYNNHIFPTILARTPPPKMQNGGATPLNRHHSGVRIFDQEGMSGVPLPAKSSSPDEPHVTGSLGKDDQPKPTAPSSLNRESHEDRKSNNVRWAKGVANTNSNDPSDDGLSMCVGAGNTSAVNDSTSQLNATDENYEATEQEQHPDTSTNQPRNNRLRPHESKLSIDVIPSAADQELSPVSPFPEDTEIYERTKKAVSERSRSPSPFPRTPSPPQNIFRGAVSQVKTGDQNTTSPVSKVSNMWTYSHKPTNGNIELTRNISGSSTIPAQSPLQQLESDLKDSSNQLEVRKRGYRRYPSEKISDLDKEEGRSDTRRKSREKDSERELAEVIGDDAESSAPSVNGSAWGDIRRRVVNAKLHHERNGSGDTTGVHRSVTVNRDSLNSGSQYRTHSRDASWGQQSNGRSYEGNGRTVSQTERYDRNQNRRREGEAQMPYRGPADNRVFSDNREYKSANLVPEPKGGRIESKHPIDHYSRNVSEGGRYKEHAHEPNRPLHMNGNTRETHFQAQQERGSRRHEQQQQHHQYNHHHQQVPLYQEHQYPQQQPQQIERKQAHSPRTQILCHPYLTSQAGEPAGSSHINQQESRAEGASRYEGNQKDANGNLTRLASHRRSDYRPSALPDLTYLSPPEARFALDSLSSVGINSQVGADEHSYERGLHNPIMQERQMNALPTARANMDIYAMEQSFHNEETPRNSQMYDTARDGASRLDASILSRNDQPALFSPQLYLKCGPSLRFGGIQTSSYGKEVWRGTLLVVTLDDKSVYYPAPFLRMFYLEMDPPRSKRQKNDPITGMIKPSRIGKTLYVRPARDLIPGANLSGVENDHGLFQEKYPGNADDEDLWDHAHSADTSSSYTDIQGIRILADNHTTFWRFDIAIPLLDEERKIAYRVNMGPPLSFFVPAKGKSMRLAVHSRNGVPESDKGRLGEKMGFFDSATDTGIGLSALCGPDPMWRDMLNRHMEEPFHAMVGVGGQAALDSAVKETVWFGDWWRKKAANSGGAKRPGSRDQNQQRQSVMTPDMRAELELYFSVKYSASFSHGMVSLAGSMIPAVNVWSDDGDGFRMFEDLGKIGTEIRSDPVVVEAWRIALKYYLLYQHHTLLDGDPTISHGWIPSPYISSLTRLPSKSFFMHMGKPLAFLALDSCSDRDGGKVLQPGTYDSVFARLRDEIVKGQTKHLVVCVGGPIVFPRHKKQVDQKVGSIRKHSVTKKIAGIFAAGGGNHGDGAERDVVFPECWTDSQFTAERRSLVHMLQQIAREKGVRVVFLSCSASAGIAAVGQFISRDGEGPLAKHLDFRYMPSIVAPSTAAPPVGPSAISALEVNHPEEMSMSIGKNGKKNPPARRLSQSSQTRPGRRMMQFLRSNVHPLDGATDESMIPMFHDGADFYSDYTGLFLEEGEGMPYFMHRRGWCSISDFEPGRSPPPSAKSVGEEPEPEPVEQRGRLSRLFSIRKRSKSRPQSRASRASGEYQDSQGTGRVSSLAGRPNSTMSIRGRAPPRSFFNTLSCIPRGAPADPSQLINRPPTVRISMSSRRSESSDRPMSEAQTAGRRSIEAATPNPFRRRPTIRGRESSSRERPSSRARSRGGSITRFFRKGSPDASVEELDTFSGRQDEAEDETTVDLTDGLDVRFWIEKRAGNAVGATKMYRLLIPALWESDGGYPDVRQEEVQQEMWRYVKPNTRVSFDTVGQAENVAGNGGTTVGRRWSVDQRRSLDQSRPMTRGDGRMSLDVSRGRMSFGFDRGSGTPLSPARLDTANRRPMSGCFGGGEREDGEENVPRTIAGQIQARSVGVPPHLRRESPVRGVASPVGAGHGGRRDAGFGKGYYSGRPTNGGLVTEDSDEDESEDDMPWNEPWKAFSKYPGRY